MKKLLTILTVLLISLSSISQTCKGITGKGKQCTRQAKEYCYQHIHSKDNSKGNGKQVDKKQCKANTATGRQCSRNASDSSKYCFQHKTA